QLYPTHRYPGAGCAADRVSRHHQRRRRGATGKRQYYQSAYADPPAGTGEPGAIITLYNNGVELATVQGQIHRVAGPYPLTRNLSEGLNILTATATDAAGNSSPTSGVFSVTLDTQPPAQPDAPLISDNVAPIIGNIGNNGATNDTTPTFSGTGEIGSTIIL
ncbi:hypothetical protein LFZ31_26155, partial [Salmonella enterica subsp. enterica serovar Newport str. S09097]